MTKENIDPRIEVAQALKKIPAFKDCPWFLYTPDGLITEIESGYFFTNPDLNCEELYGPYLKIEDDNGWSGILVRAGYRISEDFNSRQTLTKGATWEYLEFNDKNKPVQAYNLAVLKLYEINRPAFDKAMEFTKVGL